MATTNQLTTRLGSYHVLNQAALESAARKGAQVQPLCARLQARAKLSGFSLAAPIANERKCRSDSTICPTICFFQQPTGLCQTKGPRKLHVRCLSVTGTSETSTEVASYHKLPGGEQLEVIEKKAKERVGAPIVFIHGSYHAAWCWAEHWMGFFADQGHDTYAISLLGQVRNAPFRTLPGSCCAVDGALSCSNHQ